MILAEMVEAINSRTINVDLEMAKACVCCHLIHVVLEDFHFAHMLALYLCSVKCSGLYFVSLEGLSCFHAEFHRMGSIFGSLGDAQASLPCCVVLS